MHVDGTWTATCPLLNAFLRAQIEGTGARDETHPTSDPAQVGRLAEEKPRPAEEDAGQLAAVGSGTPLRNNLSFAPPKRPVNDGLNRLAALSFQSNLVRRARAALLLPAPASALQRQL